MITVGDPGTADLINQYLGSTKTKAVNETVNNSTVLQTDDDLQWPVVAGATYHLRAMLHYRSSTVADIKIKWTLPTAADLVYGIHGFTTTLTQLCAGAQTSPAIFPLGGNSPSILTAIIIGTVTIGVNPGSLVLQWAQNTAEASDTIMWTGTTGTLWRTS